MLLPGSVRPRPPRGKSQAHHGVAPLSPFTSGQLFQPLPTPLGQPPYHVTLDSLLPKIAEEAASAGHLVFHVVGDTGGVKTPDFQRHAAASMKGDLNGTDGPRFFYHLGDVVYYNGRITDYYDQFYEPYDHYAAPIVAIPGNHDGDPINASQTSLDGYVAYFMTPSPHVDPVSRDAPRVTLSLPNVYFTLLCPFVTIVGMYTNVPEGGSIDSVQQQWLTNELATAPQDKALIVAMHHPIYSFDDHHSGSPRMADALQHAINDSRRVPNVVFAAHVHNYQRIERGLTDGAATPFIVAGLGGYYHLHNLSAGQRHDRPRHARETHRQRRHPPRLPDADRGCPKRVRHLDHDQRRRRHGQQGRGHVPVPRHRPVPAGRRHRQPVTVSRVGAAPRGRPLSPLPRNRPASYAVLRRGGVPPPSSLSSVSPLPVTLPDASLTDPSQPCDNPPCHKPPMTPSRSWKSSSGAIRLPGTSRSGTGQIPGLPGDLLCPRGRRADPGAACPAGRHHPIRHLPAGRWRL